MYQFLFTILFLTSEFVVAKLRATSSDATCKFSYANPEHGGRSRGLIEGGFIRNDDIQ